jgi:hypothetical protein
MRNEVAAATFTTYARTQGRTQPPSATSARCLSQICQQIRHEFLPLFQQCLVYPLINIRDAKDYIKTFLKFSDTGAYASLFGSLRIELGSSASVDRPETNVLPLFRLLLLAPKLHATFFAVHLITAEGTPDFVSDLTKLLRIMKTGNKMVHEHILGGSFHSIMLSLPITVTNVPCLRLLLKQGLRTGCASDAEFIEAMSFGHMKELKVILCRKESKAECDSAEAM